MASTLSPSGVNGVNIRRSPFMFPVGTTLDAKTLPPTFPMTVWSEQSGKYANYWYWYTGEALEETRKGNEVDGKQIKKYPLKINPVRIITRKHAIMLLGQGPDTSTTLPLIRAKFNPKLPLDGGEDYNEEDKKLAKTCQNVVDEIWSTSEGRALQQENATITQFLGGCVFRIDYINNYDPRAESLRIPVVISNVLPDFFVPVWASNDYWNLLEAYVIYRIPVHIAVEQYGIDAAKYGTTGYVNYCEHWTRTHYSIFINNEPLQQAVGSTVITYNKIEHPFGCVPFVYIPHLREGDFWGPSLVDELEGLTRELNSRLADIGDNMRDTVHRKRYISDSKSSKPQKLANNVWAVNVGDTNITTKASPKVWTEDGAKLPDGQINYAEDILWSHINRAGDTSNISFGEDDVSQRSAVALSLRMYPSTSHADMERNLWTTGMNHIARICLRILAAKKPKGLPEIPSDWEKRVTVTQSFQSQIPRDREQLVNELILRFTAGGVSLEAMLEKFGDTDYIPEEIEKIREDQKFKSELETSQKENSMLGKATTSPAKSTDGLDD